MAAGGFYVYTLRQPSGSSAMQGIAMAIHKGATVVGVVDHDTRHEPARQGLILSRVYGTLRRIGWP
jgi:hypothetical protein